MPSIYTFAQVTPDPLVTTILTVPDTVAPLLGAVICRRAGVDVGIGVPVRVAVLVGVAVAVTVPVGVEVSVADAAGFEVTVAVGVAVRVIVAV